MSATDWRALLAIAIILTASTIVVLPFISTPSEARDHHTYIWYDEKQTQENRTCPWNDGCAHVHKPNTDENPTNKYVFFHHSRKAQYCPFVSCVSHKHNYYNYSEQLLFWSLDVENISQYSTDEQEAIGARNMTALSDDETWDEPGAIKSWNERNVEQFSYRGNGRNSIYPTNANLHDSGRIRDAYVQVHSFTPVTRARLGDVTGVVGRLCSLYPGICERELRYIRTDSNVNVIYDYRIHAPDAVEADDPTPPARDPDTISLPATYESTGDSDEGVDDTVIYRTVIFHEAEVVNVTYQNSSTTSPVQVHSERNVTDHGLRISPDEPMFHGKDLKITVHVRIRSKVRNWVWEQDEWCDDYDYDDNECDDWDETWTAKTTWDNDTAHIHHTEKDVDVYKFDAEVKYTRMPGNDTMQIYIDNKMATDGLMPLWNDVVLPYGDRGFTSFRYVTMRKTGWDVVNKTTTPNTIQSDVTEETLRNKSQAQPHRRWYNHSVLRPGYHYAFPAGDAAFLQAGRSIGDADVVYRGNSSTTRLPPNFDSNLSITVMSRKYSTASELVVTSDYTPLTYSYNPTTDRGRVNELEINGIVQGTDGNVTQVERIETHRPDIDVTLNSYDEGAETATYTITVKDPETGTPINTQAANRGYVTIDGTKYETDSNGNITYTVSNYHDVSRFEVTYHPLPWWEEFNTTSGLNSDVRLLEHDRTKDVNPEQEGTLDVIFSFIFAFIIPVFLFAIVMCFLDNILPMSMWPFSEGDCKWLPTLEF